MSRRWIAAAAILSACLSATGAHASMDWHFASSSGNSTGTSWGNQRSWTSDGVTVTATAWANTGGSDASVSADQQVIRSAYLGWWGGSGLGVTNRDGGNQSYKDQHEGDAQYGEHATDNNQRYDTVLLSFSEAVKLESLKLGWLANDSDMTVLAYTGAADGAPLAGLQYQGLLASGWELIGHYANLTTNVDKLINPDNVVSSFWLIGAFNPLVGGTTPNDAGAGNDYVKLAAVGASRAPTPPQGNVPEPGSLILAALGISGLLRMRRRAA